MFRIKRALIRPDRAKNGTAQHTPKPKFTQLKKLSDTAFDGIKAAAGRALESGSEFARQPLSKRAIKFVKRYSTQLSFAILVTIFLTVAVGEGQAYELQTPTLAAQLDASSNGFIGKPEIFGGQTVLTGEVQQDVAIIYKVEKGDSMSSIANRYSLSVGSILDANNIKAVDAEKVQPGTQLIIPTVDTNTSLAWLDTINKAKADERLRAEAERKKQLARTQQNSQTRNSRSVSYSTGSYDVIGKMWGQYNGGYPGQCTWYANYKRPDLPNGMGNGGQYLSNARAKGLPTGSVARPGALFVSSESSYYGHVGYVESVNSGMMTVTEMNYVGTGIISRRTVPTNFYAIKGFVY